MPVSTPTKGIGSVRAKAARICLAISPAPSGAAARYMARCSGVPRSWIGARPRFPPGCTWPRPHPPTPTRTQSMPAPGSSARRRSRRVRGPGTASPGPTSSKASSSAAFWLFHSCLLRPPSATSRATSPRATARTARTTCCNSWRSSKRHCTGRPARRPGSRPHGSRNGGGVSDSRAARFSCDDLAMEQGQQCDGNAVSAEAIAPGPGGRGRPTHHAPVQRCRAVSRRAPCAAAAGVANRTVQPRPNCCGEPSMRSLRLLPGLCILFAACSGGGGADLQAPAVSALPAGGVYATAQAVLLTASENSEIHCSTDGVDPAPGAADTSRARAPGPIYLQAGTLSCASSPSTPAAMPARCRPRPTSSISPIRW